MVWIQVAVIEVTVKRPRKRGSPIPPTPELPQQLGSPDEVTRYHEATLSLTMIWSRMYLTPGTLLAALAAAIF